MLSRVSLIAAPWILAAVCSQAQTTVVPTDVQLPGTQPGEVPGLESPNKCDNCHGGYDAAVEPAHNWHGGMMSHAARDPLFWATVAVAEKDFAGAGDLCIRCHTPKGWLGGRSTPTDGSALKTDDGQGVACDACHQMVDPSGLGLPGVQFSPFVANDGGNPVEGYYGSAEYVIYTGNAKLGPYGNAASTHSSLPSDFHRSSEFCGTCHDVSNSVVGDLAPGNGAQVPLDPLTFSGVPGSPVDGKAAFNNPPYAYGMVERTFSEHMASAFPGLSIAGYTGLPAELQAGSLQRAYDAALLGGTAGNYADGTPRTFTCQTCHMSPVTGKGCNKSAAPLRSDLPLHDMTGGNTWVPEAMQYLDQQGDTILGGTLTPAELAGLQDGIDRARRNLQEAASLIVVGDTVRVVNLTGHKLISGFPEGRRMWLRVRWYDALGGLLREDGAYGGLGVSVGSPPIEVQSLLDPDGPHAHIWAAHYGMSQEWAAALVGLGFDANLALAFDRLDGSVDLTLGQLAAQAPGTAEETLHFVLNDRLKSDNRIPPYGLAYDEARLRNVLPVPANQFGDPGPGGTYRYWDEVQLNPPAGAVTADLELMYQTTSWEYVQFLQLAGQSSSAFLSDAPENLLEAWLATGMSPPELMTSATWTGQLVDCNQNGVDDALDIALGTSPDCNGNGVPDECDLAGGTSLDLDGEGTPDECQPLSADAAQVSIAQGGQVGFTLLSGPNGAGQLYALLGSLSGTSPGLLLDGHVLPLNYDAYFALTLTQPNGGLLQGSIGFFDPLGGASAALVAPAAAIPPALTGASLYHAFAALDALGTGAVFLTSNPIPTVLGP